MLENANDTIDPHATDDAPTTAVAGAPTGNAADKPGYEMTPDGNLVKVGDKTYVRSEALHEERTKSANYAKTLQQLEPLMPEFERFLQQQKGGRTATVDRATRAADTGDYAPDELEGYAITRGYYDAENKPDLRRAKDDLDIMTAIADRRANRAIRPVAESTTRDRANANHQRAIAQTWIDGEPVAEQKYIDAAFNAIPEQMRADSNISEAMQVMAAGLQALDDRRAGRHRGRRGEPLFREGGGGRIDPSGGGDALDALDRAAAKARGKTPDQWAKMSKAVGGTSFGGTILDEV